MRRAGLPLVFVIAALALLALLGYGVANQGDDNSIDAALAKGSHPAAPSRALPVLGASGTRTLADYRGRVVVLNVWASWCEPCKTETPLLERLQHQLAGHGGTVVGITYKDLTSDAEAFARHYALTYPILRDVSGDFAQAYGVTGVPETFVIDRAGRIVAARRFQVDQRWIDANVLPLLRTRA